MLCCVYKHASDPPRNNERLTSDVVQECGSRFRAPVAIHIIVQEFYNGHKKLSNQPKSFITRISGPFICVFFLLIFCVLEYTSVLRKRRVCGICGL